MIKNQILRTFAGLLIILVAATIVLTVLYGIGYVFVTDFDPIHTIFVGVAVFIITAVLIPFFIKIYEYAKLVGDSLFNNYA